MAKLAVMDETRQSLIQQGVTPHFVLAFRSGATFFVQTDVEKMKPGEPRVRGEDRLNIAGAQHSPRH